MYLELTRKNINKVVIDDDGWGRFETANHRWERLDPGVWLNVTLNELAIRQDNGSWTYMNNTYQSLRDCLRQMV